MFAVLLDTSVLWPSLQRDVLLSFAAEGLYRPLWSAAILEELEYHEENKLRRLGTSDADARSRSAGLIVAMRTAFDDAEVAGWEPLEGSFALPDPDDEHVVAAAVVGGAGVVVTHNTRDFPRDRVPSTIEVQAPDVFAEHTVSVNPRAALRAIEMIAARSGRKGPPRDVAAILAVLEQRYGFTAAVQEIKAAREGGRRQRDRRA